MIDKNQLYKKITYLLINIFKSDKLKVNIIKTAELSKNVLLQINNLLSLEKDHDCNFEGQTYAIAFAQSLVNLTEEEQTIEKQDNKSVQEIEGDYSFLLTYLLNIYKIEKEKMSVASEISINLIDQLSSIADQSLLKPELVRPDEILEGSKNFNNHTQEKENKNNTFDSQNVNFNPHSESGQTNLMFLNSIPPHPATDPRFYPFLTKPKHMPLIRVLILLFVLGVIIANTVLLIYAALSSVTIELNKANNPPVSEFWVNKKNSQILLNMSPDNNKDNYEHYYGKDGKKLNYPIINLIIFIPAFLIAAMALYLCYQLFKKPATIREKYRLRPHDLMVFILLNVIIVFFWGTKFSNFQSSEMPAEKESEKDTVKKLTEFIVNYIKEIHEFKVATILAVIAIVLAVITIIFMGIILFINPKLDQRKINFANEEYQKAMANAMNGKKYEFDPSLFDEFDVEEKEHDV